MLCCASAGEEVCRKFAEGAQGTLFMRFLGPGQLLDCELTTPRYLQENATKEEAEKLQKALVAVGAEVTLD